MAEHLHERLYTAIDMDPLLVIPIVEAELADRDAELERVRNERDDARMKAAELREYQVGIKRLTTDDGAIDTSLHMAHDMMRACVAGFVKILDADDAPNYVELAYSLRNDPERYTVVIQRPRGKTPGEVAGDAKQQARRAEAERDAARALLRTALHLRSHGERAPGGTETWQNWERATETHLRGGES